MHTFKINRARSSSSSRTLSLAHLHKGANKNTKPTLLSLLRSRFSALIIEALDFALSVQRRAMQLTQTRAGLTLPIMSRGSRRRREGERDSAGMRATSKLSRELRSCYVSFSDDATAAAGFYERRVRERKRSDLRPLLREG